MLPKLLRLRKDLTMRETRTAIAVIIPAALATLASFAAMFILADLASPSFLPWLTLFGLGVIPLFATYERFGHFPDEEEQATTSNVEDLAAYRTLKTWKGISNENVRKAG